MPAHYWECVTESELEWGVETVHGFLELVAFTRSVCNVSFISWRRIGTSGKVRVMMCTWDRQGLLAKAAAAFQRGKIEYCGSRCFHAR